MAASGKDLIKYVTEQFVRYLETPVDQRKAQRRLRKERETWSSRWFGMMPISVKMAVPRKRRKVKRKTSRSHVQNTRNESGEAHSVTYEDG
ncbi:YqzE family protein [Marinicrinis sediminis]|uniref:YqzE family protein n=1 Tax=Marinicrinis sediminis TaxID=1652465 RepID=A0ABW5R6C6_9BACL